jgi:hypothetical protein
VGHHLDSTRCRSGVVATEESLDQAVERADDERDEDQHGGVLSGSIVRNPIFTAARPER